MSVVFVRADVCMCLACVFDVESFLVLSAVERSRRLRLVLSVLFVAARAEGVVVAPLQQAQDHLVLRHVELEVLVHTLHTEAREGHTSKGRGRSKRRHTAGLLQHCQQRGVEGDGLQHGGVGAGQRGLRTSTGETSRRRRRGTRHRHHRGRGRCGTRSWSRHRGTCSLGFTARVISH